MLAYPHTCHVGALTFQHFGMFLMHGLSEICMDPCIMRRHSACNTEVHVCICMQSEV